MKLSRLAGTYLLLAAGWLGARAAVAILCGGRPGATLALHAVVVPLGQLLALEGARALWRAVR